MTQYSERLDLRQTKYGEENINLDDLAAYQVLRTYIVQSSVNLTLFILYFNLFNLIVIQRA